ncbi:ATP synthase gamma chain [Lachnospiraceae bacterium KM106-2]|nr:ATP synthase gamma chain [Lachnospiraceae bacterium KM106-2]
MASMRDIKRRKESIQSTGQITKAMKLVSTVKLQKSKSRAEQSKPYFDHMYHTVNSMLKKAGDISHPYLQPGESTKKAVIVITSNRGLAGGYNSNVIKLITDGELNKDEIELYTVGRKGRDTLVRRGYEVKKDYSEVINNPLYSDAATIGTDVLESFANGEVGEIYLAYTVFKNTVSQEATLIKLLPVDQNSSDEEEAPQNSIDALTLMNFEPEAEEALNMIIPKYLKSLIYGALVESLASENGARMQAMDSATNNAEEMINHLSLSYNRARQASITQELTEIVAGASAIE